MKHLKMLTISLVVMSLLFGATSTIFAQDDPIVVGSKDFTEQRFLGYIILVALEQNGFAVEDSIDLGGTAIARAALESGEIDVYPNYTATAAIQSLPNLGINVPEGVAGNAFETYTIVSSLDQAYNNLCWLQPAPANNTYTIATTRAFAEENGLVTFEDVAEYVNNNDVSMISNEEFTTREDGLVTFEDTYGFEIPRENIESLPGAVTAQAQQQLAAGGEFDFAVAYGTDGTLATFDLVVFADPLGAQPVYQPTPVFNCDVIQANPEIVDILNPIFATFDVATLQTWNSYAAEGIDPDGNPISLKDLALLYLTETGFVE